MPHWTNQLKHTLVQMPFAILLKQMLEKLVPTEIPIQAKVLKCTCLVFIIASLCGLIMNTVLGFPLQLNLIIAACTLLVTWLFISLPLYEQYNRSGLILILLGLTTIAMNWFSNGGLYSSTPLFLMLLIGLAAVILTGAYLWWTVTICILVTVCLIILESYFPQWLTAFDIYSWQVKSDIIFAITLISYVMAWFVSLISKVNRQQFVRAEEASQAKSIFLSQLSHELRTPLNAVIGFSNHMLKKELSPDKQNDFLKRVNTNGFHLLALVNQILDLSLIETGKLDIIWQEVNLSSLLAEIEDVVSIQAREKGLSYQTIFAAELTPEQPLKVNSDPNRIRQILINLIGNGIKYTQSGGITCHVSRQSEQVQIEIEDTGPGIPLEFQKQIFEPFSRLEQHSHLEGTGMGLTITRLICQHLGCELDLSRSSAQGSVFTLLIPLEAKPIQTPGNKQNP